MKDNITTGHYFKFERGFYQRQGDKPTVFHSGSGRAYVGGLTEQERKSLDAHIDLWFECREADKPLCTIEDHVKDQLVGAAKFVERMRNERYCIPEKSYGGADPQLLAMSLRRAIHMLEGLSAPLTKEQSQ